MVRLIQSETRKSSQFQKFVMEPDKGNWWPISVEDLPKTRWRHIFGEQECRIDECHWVSRTSSRKPGKQLGVDLRRQSWPVSPSAARPGGNPAHPHIQLPSPSITYPQKFSLSEVSIPIDVDHLEKPFRMPASFLLCSSPPRLLQLQPLAQSNFQGP